MKKAFVLQFLTGVLLLGSSVTVAYAAPSGAMGAMMASSKKMSADMMQMKMSGDADSDFAAMMIPHHQGAVDMAKIELKYGKNPELRKAAQKMIADQTKEIADMKAWRAAHPVKPMNMKM
jgi:uncharacterized protein (DUF305 family)